MRNLIIPSIQDTRLVSMAPAGILHIQDNGGDFSQGYYYDEGQVVRTYYDRPDACVCETDDEALGESLARDLAAKRISEDDAWKLCHMNG